MTHTHTTKCMTSLMPSLAEIKALLLVSVSKILLVLYNKPAYTKKNSLVCFLHIQLLGFVPEMASSIFLRAPNVVMPNSLRSWSVRVKNVWRSIWNRSVNIIITTSSCTTTNNMGIMNHNHGLQLN